MSHVLEARFAAGEEVGEQLPFRRGLRMEGEVRVVRGDAVFDFEFANAPGAQVAPGSHEVGEDFQDGGIRHGGRVYCSLPDRASYGVGRREAQNRGSACLMSLHGLEYQTVPPSDRDG